MNRIYAEFKDKGLEVISFDQDRDAAKATEYLARHHYEWKNFHDEDRKVATALQCDGFPLAVLIDANGKIIYFDFGGEDADLRKAIAGLGPEFAPAPHSDEDKQNEASNPPSRN